MIRRDDLASLPKDIVAGIILGAVMVPVGLAFGSLAGAPLAGLYAGILPLIAYALFGSSRQMIVGPDATMAAIVAVSVAPLAGGDPARLVVLAGTLAVMIGLICIAGGLLRFGFLADFLSKATIVGYMHGLALVIAVGQLPKVLGIKAEGETTLGQAIDVVRNIGGTNLYDVAIGVGCVAIIQLCRRFAPAVPGQVVALLMALAAVPLFDLERRGVAVVGTIPTGLPHFQLPLLNFVDLQTLLPVAFLAALVSFSDTMVTARGFASRNRYRVDANRELIAIGAGNIAAGLSQGLPISASGSRTAVAEASGAKTQVTSVVAALVVCGILFVTGPLYYLPQAALGGLLLSAAWNLCDMNEFRRIWRFGGLNLGGALITLAGVIGLGVMEGIGIGMAYSFILLTRFLSMPADAVLGRVAPNDFHDLTGHPEAQPVPGVVVYRFSAPLFFMNCTPFRRRVEALADGDPKLEAVVVDAGAMNGVDLAGCELLAELQEALAARGIKFALGNMRTHVREQLARGWPGSAEGLHYPSVGAAVDAVAPRASTGAV
jgi:high affinity sulfate transporter 1